MHFSSFVGLRYLRAKKNNTFLSLITFFSIVGVALGVATLIVTLSVMDGFETALRDRLMSGEYHMLVTRAAKAGEPYFPFTLEDAGKYYGAHAQILSVNPILGTEAIIKAKRRVAGVSLRGITEAQMNQVARLLVEAKATVQGEPLPKTIHTDGLWLGRELAYQLAVLPGDSVQVVSPTETEGPLESVPRLRSFVVEGVFESGLPEKDMHTAYASLEGVRGFLRKPAVVNEVELRMKDIEASVPAAAALRDVLGEEFLVKDWQQLNAHLFASLRLERVTMFVILSMIICVASFNVVTSLRMNVIEKRKELAILQTMGATGQRIGQIFLVQGVVIGLLGTITGVILGLGIALALKRYPLIQLPEVFYDRSLPVVINPFYVADIAITALGIVLLAALSPARAAAQMSPLEGIRES